MLAVDKADVLAAKCDRNPFGHLVAEDMVIFTRIGAHMSFAGRVAALGRHLLRSIVSACPPVLDPLKFTVEAVRTDGTFNIRVRRRSLYTFNYDLFVDGFWRSANSYAVEAMRVANPQIRIRSHCHDPIFAIMALRNRKPVCILIRDPEQAIASFATLSQRTLDRAIEDYIAYYSALMKYRASVLIIPFEHIVRDMGDVVSQIHKRFGLTMNIPPLDDTFNMRVFDRVRALPWGGDSRTVSVPDQNRADLLHHVMVLLSAPKYTRRMRRAREIYARFIDGRA